LLDQDAVTSGAAAKGEPWRFYDLGHGHCRYDFFDQCPRRMACANCAFYRPKGSSQARMLEAKANLLRLRQDIPLTDDERAAVDDGLEAPEKLCARLTDMRRRLARHPGSSHRAARRRAWPSPGQGGCTAGLGSWSATARVYSTPPRLSAAAAR
jgi:hypothetical protein